MEYGNWTLAPGKYLTSDEVGRLLSVARHRAQVARANDRKVAVRDYFVIHLPLVTGLRVMEIAALNCGNVSVGDKLCSVLVRKGKGGKGRHLLFTQAFREHCEAYLR